MYIITITFQFQFEQFFTMIFFFSFFFFFYTFSIKNILHETSKDQLFLYQLYHLFFCEPFKYSMSYKLNIFKKVIYQQVDDVAMESPLGPNRGNFFLGYCDSK